MDHIIHTGTHTHTQVLTLIFLVSYLTTDSQMWLCVLPCQTRVYYHSKVCWLKSKIVEKVQRSVSTVIFSNTVLSLTFCPLWPEKMQETKYMPVQCENILTI